MENSMPRSTTVLLIAAALAMTASSEAAEPGTLNILDQGDPASANILRDYVRGLAHEALDRRLATYEKLKTPDQIESWQLKLREQFKVCLGGFPDRDLKVIGPDGRREITAHVVSRIARIGYRIENVIYESLPEFPVTANLYLPDSKPPYPAVLVPCGHTENGKAATAYQRVCILLAKNGIAALIYDPIGQGERKQILKRDEASRLLPTGQFKSTSEHMVAGVAPVPLGKNLATYCIWDGMRGIDYLQSRDDIDPEKIGCTGNSGGGNLTSFLMSLDDRIVCSAPGNFITTTRIKNVRPGPGDAEQNIFGQTLFGIDHPDFLMMRAPHPALILAATQDFVPIEGSWIAFRQAKRLYSRLGFSERVDLVETDAKHGYNSELRVAMVRWMRRWLLNADKPVTEHANEETLPEERLYCTPQGQVLLDKKARSVFDLYREEADRAAVHRRTLLSSRDASGQRGVIRRVSGVRSVSDLPPLNVEQVAAPAGGGPKVDRFILKLFPGLATPIVVFRPEKPTGNAVLFVSDEGKAAAVSDPRLTALLRRGTTVVAVDVAGFGETEMKPWRYGTMSGVLGPNSAEYYVLYMMGSSLVRLRTEELLQCQRFVRETLGLKGELSIDARGAATIPALHALACEPELFGRARLEGGLKSWDNVARTTVTKRQLCNTIHGALQSYDLPDLRRLIGKDRLTIVDPRNAAGEPAK
jgi:dienelactone hydrolase